MIFLPSLHADARALLKEIELMAISIRWINDRFESTGLDWLDQVEAEQSKNLISGRIDHLSIF